jgi:hypothetical protein
MIGRRAAGLVAKQLLLHPDARVMQQRPPPGPRYIMDGSAGSKVTRRAAAGGRASGADTLMSSQRLTNSARAKRAAEVSTGSSFALAGVETYESRSAPRM